MSLIKFQIRIEIEEDGDTFYAYCPTLKGVHVEGDTIEDAVENAKDAALAHIISIHMHQDPLPIGVEEVMPFTSIKKSIMSFLKPKHITRNEDLEVSFA